MTERERFEEWCGRMAASDDGKQWFPKPHALDRKRYRDTYIQASWDAWQASRRAALEDAASKIDEYADFEREMGKEPGADLMIFARAIRALIGGD